MPTRIDLTQPDGSPLSPADLAAIVGLSHWTIRRDIALGALHAGVRHGPRGRPTYVIPWREARRYAMQLGVLRVTIGTD